MNSSGASGRGLRPFSCLIALLVFGLAQMGASVLVVCEPQPGAGPTDEDDPAGPYGYHWTNLAGSAEMSDFWYEVTPSAGEEINSFVVFTGVQYDGDLEFVNWFQPEGWTGQVHSGYAPWDPTLVVWTNVAGSGFELPAGETSAFGYDHGSIAEWNEWQADTNGSLNYPDLTNGYGYLVHAPGSRRLGPPDVYVSTNGQHIHPFTNWVTAATNIQAAVDAAGDGTVIHVTNGVYASDQEILVDINVRLRSVNGPEHTVVDATATAPPSRCFQVTDLDAVIEGFTVTGGSAAEGGGIYLANNCGMASNCIITGNSADVGGGVCGGALYNCTLTDNSADEGGGAWGSALYNCVLAGNSGWQGGGASGGTLYNCRLIGNSAWQGGGAFGSTLYNCSLTDNSASYGGGTYVASLYNCTLAGNSASYYGGGADYGKVHNCVVYFNTAPEGPNYSGYEDGYIGMGTDVSVEYTCTTPLPPGPGNLTNEPMIVSLANPRLLPGSPCINAGSNQAWMAGSTDLAGRDRIHEGVADMGAYEFHAGTQIGALSAAISANYTNVAPGFAVTFAAAVEGECAGFVWNWKDGDSTPDHALTRHAYDELGTYDVVLTASNLSTTAATTVTVHVVEASVHYVSPNGSHEAPFTNWATAATTIQAALDVAGVGATVWVTNGVYDTGGVAGYPAGGLLTNRVVVARPVMVRSVNGPDVTIIKGCGPVGNAAVRGVYMVEGASLIGFTVTNGATRTTWGSDGDGGGIWAEGAGAVVSNCLVVGNSAWHGGGAYWGALYNCALPKNLAEIHGGGTLGGRLYHCALTGNSAGWYGGGARGGRLYDCLLSGNSAEYGGGAYWGTLDNCTLSGNSAVQFGGGTAWGALCNSIVYSNSAAVGPNHSGGHFTYTCTTPLPDDEGNISDEPVFVDPGSGYGSSHVAGDYRLQSNSPCINRGTNYPWMNDPEDPRSRDLNGNPRIFGAGRVDMGAYEYQASLSDIDTNWLASHGLPIDGSADYEDLDGDSFVVWEEYVAETDPTNFNSRPPSLKWHEEQLLVETSVVNRVYLMLCKTNLMNGFWIEYTNKPGTGTALFFEPDAGTDSTFFRYGIRLQ